MKDEALKLALEALEDIFGKNKVDVGAINAIKQALAAPVQEPVAWAVHYNGPIPLFTKTKAEAEAWGGNYILPLYTTPPAAPVAWKWHQAPVKTSWGHDMVVADLAIDKDNTVSVYCERDQTAKVEAMFTPPAAQPAKTSAERTLQHLGYTDNGGEFWKPPLGKPAPVQEPVGDDWTPCMKLPVVVHVRQQRPGESHVSTREGITPVKPDDLIMRGVSGEEYPIGRAIFEQTYTLDTTPPAQQAVEVCCGKYKTCLKPCTPRGEFLALSAIEAKLKEKNI